MANAILKARGKVKRFLHISSSEVYGTAQHDKMNECHPLEPKSPYASAKCGADRLIYSYWATYGIPAVIVRPFNNYGPRQHLEKAVPRFITSCLLGEELTVHGDGSAARDWLFVEDNCAAIDLILHADAASVAGRVFNVGSGRDISVLDVARQVAAAMGQDEERIVFLGDRPAQVFRHTCDASALTSALGWEPETTFEAG